MAMMGDGSYGSGGAVDVWHGWDVGERRKLGFGRINI